MLYEGRTPFNIVPFYQELSKGLSTALRAEDIKKIADQLSVIYNAKLKEEKGPVKAAGK